MKIVICGDSHIGAVYGLGGSNNQGGNTRIDDYEKTLNYIADYCIENHIDVFIQTGDVFDKRNPTSEQMDIVNQVLKKLSSHNIFSILIMGNHDYKKTGPSFTSSITGLAAKDLPNVRLVIHPELISISSQDENLNLLLMPFRDRKFYNGGTTKEDSFLYETEVASLLNTKVPGPVVAVGHNFFFEGSYNDYGGSEILARVEAFKECDMIAMGHYHNFKILKKSNPIAFYTGSMEKINFGDIESKKVFIEFDTQTKRPRILTAPVRELFDQTIDLSFSTLETIDSDLEKAIQDLEVNGKIVRLKIIIHEQLTFSLKKLNIEKKLYDMQAHYVSKINFEQIYQRIIRDISILDQKDDFSIFEAFVKGQALEEDLEKRILLESKTIMG